MTSASQRAAVLDAVCCVQFCAAGKYQLLLDTLRTRGLTLLIPGEVDVEVRNKGKNKTTFGRLTVQWAKLTAAQDVHVLEVLNLSGRQQRVLDLVAEIRDVEAEQALQQRKHLGEIVTVAHAVALTEAGDEVYVCMDDEEGIELADAYDVPVIEMTEVLADAIRQERFTTLADLRSCYDELRKYGGSLPPWDNTDLKQLWREHQRTTTE